MAIVKVTDSNFDENIQSGVKLVDFWATWCGPCQMLAPVIEEIAKDQEGIIKVGKVNVDEQPALAMKYQVSSIPTVILFKNGAVVDTKVGFQSKSNIEAMFK